LKNSALFSVVGYRPHLLRDLTLTIRRLERVSRSPDANIRRFSVEVSRPRSVWGAHAAALKENPNRAISIIENVRSDESRYVQLAAGNWLNDASKTQPDWVLAVCTRWVRDGNPFSHRIVKRGLRTIGSADRFIPARSFGKISTEARSFA
jgi:3-methyladenine DNA glycosylase AlkC